jgi:hypothetical protein
MVKKGAEAIKRINKIDADMKKVKELAKKDKAERLLKDAAEFDKAVGTVYSEPKAVKEDKSKKTRVANLHEKPAPWTKKDKEAAAKASADMLKKAQNLFKDTPPPATNMDKLLSSSSGPLKADDVLDMCLGSKEADKFKKEHKKQGKASTKTDVKKDESSGPWWDLSGIIKEPSEAARNHELSGLKLVDKPVPKAKPKLDGAKTRYKGVLALGGQRPYQEDKATHSCIVPTCSETGEPVEPVPNIAVQKDFPTYTPDIVLGVNALDLQMLTTDLRRVNKALLACVTIDRDVVGCNLIQQRIWDMADAVAGMERDVKLIIRTLMQVPDDKEG